MSQRGFFTPYHFNFPFELSKPTDNRELFRLFGDAIRFFGSGTVKGVVTALDTRVKQITLFISASAEVFFKILIRRQKVKVPLVESFVQFAHILSGLFYFFQVAQPFAVGRIAYRNAIALARHKVLRFAYIKLYLFV